MKIHLWYLSLIFIPTVISKGNLCEKVTCFGQSVCHEVTVPCSSEAAGCMLQLPACSDKSIMDYTNDLLASKAMEEIFETSDYIKSNDREVLCRGFNCFGRNTCSIVSVVRVNDPTGINYLPSCNDSPVSLVT